MLAAYKTNLDRVNYYALCCFYRCTCQPGSTRSSAGGNYTLSKEEPIDQIWFLGDLVGYGPNPNECITMLRKRTDVIIAGNHDWAAVGKIDLEDFSTAARVSAEWTAQQLTEEHRAFLTNLPERLEIGDCTLVHGSPYGPLWEYLTSEALAERSFQHFSSRLCLVGHTHVPVIFQQPDSISNAPTLPLEGTERNGQLHTSNDTDTTTRDAAVQETDSADMTNMAMVSSNIHTSKAAAQAESAYADPATGQPMTEDDANAVLEKHTVDTDQSSELSDTEMIVVAVDTETPHDEAILAETAAENAKSPEDTNETSEETVLDVVSDDSEHKEINTDDAVELNDNGMEDESATDHADEAMTGDTDEMQATEESLNSEIEELLELLGLTESMIQVTNEMVK